MRYLMLALCLFAFNAEASEPQQSAPQVASPKQSVTPIVPKIKNPAFAYAQKTDWVQGNPAAKVTVTEYASLSCPHCAVFNEKVFPEIAKKYMATNKIQFIYRDFPLNAPALKAGIVARCVPEEKREAFIATLYKNQAKWAFSKDFEINLQTLAIDNGMSKKTFKKCLSDKKLEEAVVKSRMDGTTELSVGGTPSIYINGERYDNAPDVSGISAAIEKHLTATSKK